MRPAYNISKLQHLLTGWNPQKRNYTNTMDYGDINNSNFGHCDLSRSWVHNIGNGALMNQQSAKTLRGKIANGCIFGGRTGYSVKMVHPDLIPDDKKPYWWYE